MQRWVSAGCPEKTLRIQSGVLSCEIYELVTSLKPILNLLKIKIFCSCTTAFGSAPNSHCCPIVCIGLGNFTSKLNREVVNFSIKRSCHSRWDCWFLNGQKELLLSDLSKAYQINQLYAPLSIGGYVELSNGRKSDFIIFILEDAENLFISTATHMSTTTGGVPLIEIVSGLIFVLLMWRRLRNYVEKLQQVMRFI